MVGGRSQTISFFFPPPTGDTTTASAANGKEVRGRPLTSHFFAPPSTYVRSVVSATGEWAAAVDPKPPALPTPLPLQRPALRCECLPSGFAADAATDGHKDNLSKFGRPGHVLIDWPSPAPAAHADMLRRWRRRR